MVNVLRKLSDEDKLFFYCPGCGMHHAFDKRWTFDGNFEQPTFSPSLLVKFPWWNGEKRIDMVCHSFIKAGKIEYLGDCTHELKGKTIEMVDAYEY